MMPEDWGLLLLLILLPGAGVLWWNRQAKSSRKSDSKNTLNLLKFYHEVRPCQIYLGIPPGRALQWQKVYRILAHEIVVTSGKVYSLEESTAFIIAYPSGEIAHFANLFYPLPSGLSFVDTKTAQIPDTVTLDQLTPGKGLLKVTYSKSLLFPDDCHYMTATLTNTSKQRLKITKFAAYRLEGQTFTLQTATGGFFTERQFREWYGLGEEEWIRPGQRVFDPHCYGATGTLWVYHGLTETNEPWVAGEVT